MRLLNSIWALHEMNFGAHYCYSQENILSLPTTGVLSLVIVNLTGPPLTSSSDVRSLPFNRIYQISIDGPFGDEPLQELWKQIYSSKIMTTLKLSKLELNISPLKTLVTGSVSSSLNVLDLSWVQVDADFPKKLSKAIIYSPALNTLELGSLQGWNSTWAPIILQRIREYETKLSTVAFFGNFTGIDYFLLGRYHKSIGLNQEALLRVQNDINARLIYGTHPCFLCTDSAAERAKPGVKMMFVGAERAGHGLLYWFYSSSKGTLGFAQVEEIWNHMREIGLVGSEPDVLGGCPWHFEA